MRRTAAIVLIAVGMAMAVLALTMRYYAYPRLAMVPLDQTTKIVSEGTGMDVLFISKDGIKVLQDVHVTSTRLVQGNVDQATEEGSDSDAFWENSVSSVTDAGQLTKSLEGVSFDRVSAEATNCCGDYIEVEEGNRQNVTHKGLFYKFPFDTQQQDYQFWDGELRKPMPAVFSGTEEIQGLATYKFVQKIDDVVLDERDVPGALFGGEGTVTADLTYGNTRTLWVEPQTGVIIRGQEEPNKRLVAADGTVAPATVGKIGYNDATVTANVDEYGPKSSSLNLVRNVVPLVGIILGPIMIIGGIALLVLGGRRTPRGGESPAPRPVRTASH